MTTVLRLRTHEAPPALAGMDAPRTVVDELVWREVGNTRDGACRVGRWFLDAGTDEGFALLWDERDRRGMLVPSAGLRAVRAAALTVTAVRLFLYSLVVTVSVLGSGLAVRVVLAELAAHVPGISDVAVHATAVPGGLAEDLALAGIGLTVAASRADAVFGANLVVLTDPPGDHDWQPARGALVVNASGQAPPDDVVAQPTRCSPTTGPGRWAPGRSTADLGQMLTGVHAGRNAPDDIVLVDLPGVDAGGVWLTYRLYEAAQR